MATVSTIKHDENYWKKIVALFLLGWIFMYATRNILSASMVSIKEEMGLNQAQLGLLSSVFFTTYTFTQVPFGMIGDKWGLKRVLILGFIFFGVFTGLTGVATTFTVLLVMRALVGVGQGTYYGPQYALSSDAIPLEHRGFGSAIINSGMAFGTSLGLMGAGFIINNLGLNWRYTFFIFALAPIIIAALFKLVVKEQISDAALAKAETVKEEKVSGLGINRNILAVYIMVFCSLFGFFIIQTWLPYFLQVERGVAAGSVGFFSSLVAWSSIPGALLFSYLSDRFKNRKFFITLLFVLALIAIVGSVYFQSFQVMLFFLCMYGLTGKLAMDPLLIASMADNAPASSRGTIFSIFNFIGMSASIVAPYVAGWLADRTGSLSSAFYLSGGLLVIGMLTAIFLSRDSIK